MIITKQTVIHKTFGRGTICGVDGAYIAVLFTCGEKRFVFPDAFDGFLKFEDETAQREIAEMIKSMKDEKRKISDELVNSISVKLRERRKTRTNELTEEIDSAFNAFEEEDNDEYSTIFDWRPLSIEKARR